VQHLKLRDGMAIDQFVFACLQSLLFCSTKQSRCCAIAQSVDDVRIDMKYEVHVVVSGPFGSQFGIIYSRGS
jgi:hypothetical protein